MSRVEFQRRVNDEVVEFDGGRLLVLSTNGDHGVADVGMAGCSMLNTSALARWNCPYACKGVKQYLERLYVGDVDRLRRRANIGAIDTGIPCRFTLALEKRTCQ